jgi:hypothetical protein
MADIRKRSKRANIGLMHRSNPVPLFDHLVGAGEQ